MFRYSICNEADEEIFMKQCSALERKIKDLSLERKLVDVDSSTTLIYGLRGKKITVCNDYYLNEVYIESDVYLEPYFKEKG